MPRFNAYAVIGLLCACLVACDAGEDAARADLEPFEDFQTAPESEPETLNWLDLLPDGEYERLTELARQETPPNLPLNHDESAPAAEQFGSFNTVADLDGAHIRMPGYLIPLDSLAGRTSRRFLLVPYQGACIHEPPPPPNQVVYVLSQEPLPTERLWDAWWVEGVMLTARADTDLAGAAYTLHLSRREAFSQPR
jgi:hypothetical protein